MMEYNCAENHQMPTAARVFILASRLDQASCSYFTGNLLLLLLVGMVVKVVMMMVKVVVMMVLVVFWT